MLNRWIENDGLLTVLEEEGIGCIAFSVLAQGMLSGKYLNGIPEGSRATADSSLDPSLISENNLAKIRNLNVIAEERGQTLPQLAIAWALRDPRVTTALIGASKVSKVEDCVKALDNLEFNDDELDRIDKLATDGGINLWAE